ncbi:hypothetical protein Poli38472_002208 [Pythium oligandrum]|uniref:Uncharacterized protein n=1 Tax=Pythium oligandrum TaxID=41045 RepID=A0A8K1CJC8_PYTOL|nr:hypothetical protein Poli38472_002208 [Pythium oligandrum]|eukprot:TMW63267.1 hypothetical protein Poli38472_002208 [Pythium oligandrum]
MSVGGDDKKQQPWDAALESVKESVDGAVKGVQDALGGNVQQVKDLARGQIDQAQELTSSARIAISRLGKEATQGLKNVVRPVIQIFEQAEGKEGTQLRKQISSARVQVNHQLYDAQLKLQETQKVADEQLVPVKSALAVAQTQLIKVNNFRKLHPEFALAGLVAVVGVPSLLFRGKLAATRNVLVAVGAGAAAAYTSDKLAERKERK